MSAHESRRYRIEEVLGQGGFGTVYRAELLSSGGFSKPVAIKVLNADVADTDNIVERLRDEARMLGLLRHRAIVQVDDLVPLEGRWSIVMEYVEGVSLKEILEAGPLSPGVALQIAEEVASALHVAFAMPTRSTGPLGLLHRDIKPSNVQITPAGEVKLLDFGVARADFDSREAQTRSMIFGSVPYLAPERFDLEDTHAGDVYALALTLAEALTGRAPERSSPIPRRHAEGIALLLEQVHGQVGHAGIDELLRRCLSYEPEARPTAQQFEREVRQLHREFPDQYLKDWAANAIPPLARARPRIPDELTGKIIDEGALVEQDSAPAAAAPPPPPPPPPPAPSPSQQADSTWSQATPRRKRRVWPWVILGLLIFLVALVVVPVLLFGGGFFLLIAMAMSATWPDQVNDSFVEHQIMVEALPSDPSRDRLAQLLGDQIGEPQLQNVGFWELVFFEIQIEDAVADGTIAPGELKAISKKLAKITAD